MRVFIFFLLFLFSLSLFSQSSFRKLSGPEKRWVIFHPFKARKAQKITRKVILVVDSVKQTGVIGTDGNGGKLDAFRHVYWMACLANAIGRKQALKLGQAHEKGNYLQFKKGTLEDAILPDSVSSEMDLRNNKIGTGYSGDVKNQKENYLIGVLINLAKQGDFVTILKNEKGEYLRCDGTVLLMRDYVGKWSIPKCLTQRHDVYH